MKIFSEGVEGGRNVLSVRVVTGLGIALSFIGAISAQAQGTQPLVAVHDSELTRALETTPASGATPTGPGTTGFQWWPTNWHYFVMPESLKETLRSDGTAFAVVSDANISGGQLLDGGGKPRYPVLISFAAEAIADSEIGPLTNYVAAGGFLVVGSSSFSRNPTGTARGNFALAAQMGVNMAGPGLANWGLNRTFTAVANHRLVAHVPAGKLSWQLPSAAKEISWPESDHTSGPPTGLLHLLWQVTPSGASVLAQADGSPYLLVKQYGKGFFIYNAAMEPLVSHGSWAPGMYSYVILRNAIEWAFQAARLPVAKLSPWPFPYDAAVTYRHDMEALPDLINSIEGSAQYEANAGVRGDYFFCTGELRVNMGNSSTTIASLRRAISNYGATIQSHNGGLPNPNTYSPPLDPDSYDYWHWSPDEVLNSSPPGYANGTAYALASLSNSFSDIDGWFAGLDNGDGLRMWVAPYFNATREGSYQIQEQLGVLVAGDQKLGGPFPHWTMSTQTSGQLYSFLTLPVSDWFVGSEVAQSMEHHTTQSMQAAVDFYYNLGALVNLYCHSSSAGGGPAGALPPAYVAYTLTKPRIWPVNMADCYHWWQARGNAQIAPSFSQAGNLSTLTFSIGGATDPNTAVELQLPDATVFALQIKTNGVVAPAGNYRVKGQTVKILVGTVVSSVDVQYRLAPTATNDVYTATQGTTLTIAAPGLLTNDAPGVAGGALTASLAGGPTKGSLNLNASGGFTFTPGGNSKGVDAFTYRANDGQTNSPMAIASVMIAPATDLFFDDMSRPTNSPGISPWVAQYGTWGITNGALTGTSGESSYGFAHYPNDNWSNYVVQARVRFSADTAWGGGIGGRLDAASGAHYAAWIFPENSGGDRGDMQLIKHEGWGMWSGTPMADVSLPTVGTNAHTVALVFQGSNIAVFFDGTLVVNVNDNNFDGVAPFSRGGICADFYQYPAGPALSVDDVSVRAAGLAPVIQSAISNGKMVLTWTTEPGHTYRQQYNDNLGTTNWNNILPDIVATNLTITATNAMAGPGRRFYRVVRVQ